MKTYNVCLVGAGAIGLVHADRYRALKTVQLTIVETDDTKRAQLIADGLHVLASLEEALVLPFDLFDICTPTAYHAPVITKILHSTKALVLCEKPLTLTLDELGAITAIPGASERILCALVEHFNEPCIALHEWTEKHPGPLTMEFKRRTKKPVNAPWFNKPELGGDILLDLGIHDIDLTLWFAHSPVVAVEEHTVVDNDHESFRLRFKNGSTAQFYLGWDLPQDHPQGIENLMRVGNSAGELWYNSDDESLHGATEAAVRPRFPQAYYDEIDEALGLAGGKLTKSRFPDIQTVTEGMQTIELITKTRGVAR